MKIMNTKKRLAGVLGVLVALCLVGSLGIPVLADAPPGFNHQFYGDVTSGGEPLSEEVLAEGVLIQARVDGDPCGSTTVDADSRYNFEVDGEVASSGDLIEFYVNDDVRAELYDVEADEYMDSYPFGSNFFRTELDLNVTVPDTTVPTVVIDDIADYVNVLAQISGTASDNVAVDEVQVLIENTTDSVFWNGTDWLSATEVWLDATDTETWTYTMPILTSDNSYQVRAKAVDTSTNESTVASDSFTFDTTAPTISITSPVDGVTEVAVDAVVSATFSEDVTLVDLSGITITGATGVSATLDEVTDTITIDHDAFAYETPYEVTIPAGAVNDLAGNSLAEAEVWSFITRAEGPVSFTTTLLEDWNLLSTPIKLDADSDALEQILGESLANIEASWRWDAQNQQWAIPTGYELSPLEAVYLKVSSGASATAEFVPYQDYSELPSRELQPGLNLIGPAPALAEGVFPDMPLDQALISIAEAEGGLTGYTMVVSPAHNQLGWAYALGGEIVEDLLPYKGYWVVMENADTLFGFSYTPTP